MNRKIIRLKLKKINRRLAKKARQKILAVWKYGGRGGEMYTEARYFGS